jgi:hypothetical protein
VELIRCDFSIAVAIHFAERFGGFIDFSGVHGAVVVCVEQAEHAGSRPLHRCVLGLQWLRIILSREGQSGKDHGHRGD